MTWVKRKSQTQAYALTGESSLKRLNISQWWSLRFISYKNNTGIIIYIWLIHRKKYIWICIKITHFNSVTIHSQVRHKHSFLSPVVPWRGITDGFLTDLQNTCYTKQNARVVQNRTCHTITRIIRNGICVTNNRTHRTHVKHRGFGCYYFVLTI